MLEKKMIQHLNSQLNLEFYSSNLYLQMSAWCDANSYSNMASFLRGHAKEELSHMQRLFDYLIGTGALPLLSAIDAPPHEYESIVHLFEIVYDHEKLITKKINELVECALKSKDYATFQFLQWYVAEQHEEEKLFKTILDKLKLVSHSNEALFFMDNDFPRIVSKSV